MKMDKLFACCGPDPDSLPSGGMQDFSQARELFNALEKELESKLSNRGQTLWRHAITEFERMYEENGALKQTNRCDLEEPEELSAAHRRIRQLELQLEEFRDENNALKERVTRMYKVEDDAPAAIPNESAEDGDDKMTVATADDKMTIATGEDKMTTMTPHASTFQDKMTDKVSEYDSHHPQSKYSSGAGSHSEGTARKSPRGHVSLSSRHSRTSRTSRSEVLVSYSRVYVRRFFNSQAFVFLSAASLCIALFGERCYVIANIPDDPGNVILDSVMIAIMMVFALEIGGTYLIDLRYRWSFFFWMDILGTVSMVFEISFLLGSLEVDTVVLRTTRVAKLGARLGRLLKLLKYFLKQPDENIQAKAKVLTANLTYSLATRVSALTIVLLCTLPLFYLPVYPKEDLSMVGWAEWLEDVYVWNGTQANLISSALDQLQKFYDGNNYAPYKISGYDFNYQFSREVPARENNIIEESVKTCQTATCSGGTKPTIYFDFTGSNQLAALMDIFMILYIMFMMVFMTSVQIYTIDNMLVKPLERMLQVVRVHAKEICDRFMEVHGGNSTAAGAASEYGDMELVQETSELELLESVLRKIARLVEVHTTDNRMFASDMDLMDQADQAVLIDMLDTKVVKANVRPVQRLSRESQDGSTKAFREWLAFSEQSSTWSLDVLAEGEEKLLDLVMHFFYVHEVGCAADLFVSSGTLKQFVRVIQLGYKDLPYHCFRHAIDVLHCVSLVLSKVQANIWLSEAEVYALMVASLAHDVGHGGKTNQFLCEVKDVLALRYNDKSPLENMHCATLFQICSNEETNALSRANEKDKKVIRQICITAILHTDNAGHFQMVKEITGFYELEKEICDLQAKSKIVLERYEHEILHKEKQRWLELWLHLADVSNPCKPFPICQAWAWRVLDEFFAQGDEEKKLGLPVGMLNDRNTVNRPGSQHGFINFLVAPLVATTVRLFPPLQQLHWQMACNLEEWRNVWIKDCSPSADEIGKKDADVKKVKDVAQELASRNFKQ